MGSLATATVQWALSSRLYQLDWNYGLYHVLLLVLMVDFFWLVMLWFRWGHLLSFDVDWLIATPGWVLVCNCVAFLHETLRWRNGQFAIEIEIEFWLLMPFTHLFLIILLPARLYRFPVLIITTTNRLWCLDTPILLVAVFGEIVLVVQVVVKFMLV